MSHNKAQKEAKDEYIEFINRPLVKDLLYFQKGDLTAGNTDRGRCFKTRVTDDQILYDHRLKAQIQM